MKLNRNRALSLAVAGVLLLLSGVAAAADVPLGNWMAPPTWTSSFTAGTLTKLSDTSNPLPFIPMTPCRMADTRGAVPAPPINGGGALVAGVPRNWTITGNSCGIPVGAAAVSANFTVVNTAGTGFLVAWPQGGVQPGVAVLVYSGAGALVSNAAVVPIAAAGGITVLAGSANTQLIMDVNGYYSQTPNTSGNYFNVVNNSGLFTIRAQNLSASCGGPCGVVGVVAHGIANYGFSSTGGEGIYGSNGDSSAPGVHGVLTVNAGFSQAVFGEHLSTGGGGIGVEGSHAGTGWGVYGHADGATGLGAHGGLFSVISTTNGATGALGEALGATGVTYGVMGLNLSTLNGSAGVQGEILSPGYPDTPWSPVAVAGDATGGFGVVGRATTGRAVQGCLVNATTGVATGASCGVLGFSATQGVFSFGDVAAAGTKTFIEPHPTDPSRQIVFISMEGPEAGTYFRGRGRFEGKTAVIPVPESFRLVTEEEGLTVQITPIGRATAVGVVSMDLNQIVAESMRDVEFSYFVQGVRKNYLGHQPIQKNLVFVPMGPNAHMEGFPPHTQKLLIDLGIYHDDGTVNMETAERLGWAQQWRDEEKARQQISPKTSTPATQVQN